MTRDNQSSAQEREDSDSWRPADKKAAQRLVPFDADDELIVEAQESLTPREAKSEREDDGGRGLPEQTSPQKSMKNVDPPSHKPSFVRKRPAANGTQEKFQLSKGS